jgi:hypothetical protein
MTREETAQILTVVRLLWPHSNLGHNPQEVVGIWHSMLATADRESVELAVREQAAAGREHAPPVGVIVKSVADRTEDIPDWDEVEREIRRAISAYRPPRDVARLDPYAAPPADYWSHPAVARFMDGVWDEWRMAREDDRTFLAQQREAYKALRARAERAGSLRLVGAPRRRDLTKPDYLAALPGGDAA